MHKIVYSLFPKYFQHYRLEEVAEASLACGFDAVDLVVREGFWVSEERMSAEAETFVRTMDDYGLQVKFATTGFSSEMLVRDETPLQVMSQLGIESFRMSYFPYVEGEDLFVQLEQARVQMHQMAEQCAKYNIKAIYQIHHGDRWLVHHAMAALYIVQGLPSQYVGIMPDPGNQFHEGLDNWRRAILTLHHYVAGIGVKDVKFEHDAAQMDRPEKGWRKVFVPSQEGVIDWHTIAKALKEIEFQGVLNFQPFYFPDQLDVQIAALKKEVTYIRSVMEKVGGDTNETL